MNMSITLSPTYVLMAKEIRDSRDKVVELTMSGNTRELNKLVKRVDGMKSLCWGDTLW